MVRHQGCEGSNLAIDLLGRRASPPARASADQIEDQEAAAQDKREDDNQDVFGDGDA